MLKIPTEFAASSKYFELKATKELYNKVKNFEDAVLAYWYYITDIDEEANEELPEEVLELWSYISAIICDISRKIDIMQSDIKLEAFKKSLAIHCKEGRLTADDKAELLRLQEIINSDDEEEY